MTWIYQEVSLNGYISTDKEGNEIALIDILLLVARAMLTSRNLSASDTAITFILFSVNDICI